jgi:N-acetylglucosamine-6-phosphate deacetylase
VAKLPDRTSFAGSIATASVLLKKGVEHYGFSIADTVKMLTATPADILGLKNKGCLKNGNIADIALFDDNFDVKMVILSGNVIER